MMILTKYRLLDPPISLGPSTPSGQLSLSYKGAKLKFRSIPIVLDDEDDDELIPGPSCPSSPDEPLPNILDLLRSDGPDFDIPSRVTKASKTKITVDRKGKGKEIVLIDERYGDVDELVKRKSKRARSRSSDVMVEMGNSYIVEGLSRPIGRVESKKRARSSEPERSETRAVSPTLGH
jgi:hypothetical protein